MTNASTNSWRWVPADPAHGGCRAIEIDITDHSDSSGGRSASYLQVSHDKGGNGPPLANYLAELKAVHAANPAHDVIFLTLDIKSEEGRHDTFPALLEAYLAQWFTPSLLFTPANLARDKTISLLDNVTRFGWPTIAALAGRFIFCLSGTEPWKAFYAEDNPWQRLCFADYDLADDHGPSVPVDGHRIVANLNLFSDHATHWTTTVPALRRRGLLVRGYVLDGQPLFESARQAGVNILATDEITGQPWARAGNEPFVATG